MYFEQLKFEVNIKVNKKNVEFLAHRSKNSSFLSSFIESCQDCKKKLDKIKLI